MHLYSSTDNRGSTLGMIAVLAVILAVALSSLYSLLPVQPAAWILSAPTVAATFGILYKLTDRYAWKWTVLHKLGFMEVPDIEGIYEGTLVSSFHQTTVPIRIGIDQTWTKIAVRFEVLEPASSTSYSIFAGLRADGHFDARLSYSYRNQTRPGIADAEMNDHDGTAEIKIDCNTGAMSGRYYNFRGNQGTLTLSRINKATP